MVELIVIEIFIAIWAVSKISVETKLDNYDMSKVDNLKMTKEVSIKTTKKYTRITIENWAKYQGVLLENDKVNDKVVDIEMTTTKEIKNNYIYFIKKYRG